MIVKQGNERNQTRSKKTLNNMRKCTKQRARKHQEICEKTLTKNEKAKQTKQTKTFTTRALTK